MTEPITPPTPPPRLIDKLPEAVRPIITNALGQVIGAAILALIVWLASQGITVELQKNTEAVHEQNELKKIELEAWGIRREQ